MTDPRALIEYAPDSTGDRDRLVLNIDRRVETILLAALRDAAAATEKDWLTRDVSHLYELVADRMPMGRPVEAVSTLIAEFSKEPNR